MFPFTRAASTQNLPNVQPDANGFYPIVSANSTPQPATTGRSTTGALNRLAWIFGAKGRQQTSPNPNAQNTPGTFANVQETEGSQNR
jgi:hypothetical protein